MNQSILVAALFLAAASARADDVAIFHKQLIQGDVKSALQTAAALAPATLPAKDAAALACIRARFAAPPVQASGPAAGVLDAYRSYWHAVLLGQLPRSEAELRLLNALNALLPGAGDGRSLNETTERARQFLQDRGLHALAGVTSPNHELMVWTKESAQTYQVALPERSVAVRVVFLDGLLSRGWLGYASCDRFGAGGWTANGVLYAVADKYELQGEDFRVSYLGHEGQHFADNADFPQLEQSELEYRAKLTELILSSDPGRLFDRFAQTAQAGRAVPHLHAEYWLTRRLRENVAESADSADRAALREAARRLLMASSADARRLGAATVKRLLPD